MYVVDNLLSLPEYEIHQDIKKEAVPKDNGDNLSFGDILDIVNPFHHLPVVSTVYRAVTNDKISPVSKIIGGTIYGRVFGFLASVVNVVVEAVTGKDIGDHVMTALTNSKIKRYAEVKMDYQTGGRISTVV